MKTAQEIFEQLNSIDENVRIDAKRASEIDKSIMETVRAFANEPGLGGGREVEAIDNITYRQLNSDINNQKASFDLHDLCIKGLLEQKGQSRNTYYIAGEKFVNSRTIGENSNAIGENSRAIGENSRAIGETCRANGETCRANGEMCRANGEMCRAEKLPDELKQRIEKTGKRMSSKEMESLIIDLCEYEPLSLAEIASLLHRDMRALRHHYIKYLIKSGKLFYTIPEMLNHPDQKYTTVKNK